MDPNDPTNINITSNDEEKKQSEANYNNNIATCANQSPSALLGRTLSASAVDYKSVWRNKKSTFTESTVNQFPFSSDSSFPSPHTGSKRKHSSQDFSNTTNNNTPTAQLPNFINSLPQNLIKNDQMLKPIPTNPNQSLEFVTPNQPKKPSNSRPSSPRPVLPRGRVASIRRESDCSGENEAAHEKLFKSAQQVSLGFEDFCLDDKLFEERKRAKSLTEPISIFTNAFLIQNSTPSPTRGNVDIQKQCYSPSTQQVVRSNISYSPSPSPTPGSPYNRMRSISPCTVRQITKRRYTASNCTNGNCSGLESDGESSASSHSQHAFPPHKKQCTTPRSTANASPLIRDTTFNLYQQQQQFVATSLAEPTTSISDIFVNSPAIPANSVIGIQNRPRLVVDSQLIAHHCSSTEHGHDGEEVIANEEDGPLMGSFCLNYDANSSTTFSSRANSPHSEMLDNSGVENDISSIIPIQSSSCSSDGSSQSSSFQKLNNLSSLIKRENDLNTG